MRFLTKFIEGFAVTLAGAPLIVLLLFAVRAAMVEDPVRQPEPEILSCSEKVESHPEPPVEVPSLELLELPESHRLGAYCSMGDYKVYTISCEDAAVETEFITLDEAIETGLCTISEIESVNALQATVTGTRPVLALAGDLLLGGQQDRIVACTVILEPGTSTVPAYCVEHGRWHARHDEDVQSFRKSEAMPQVDLRVKGAAATGSQSAVWQSVAQANRDVQAHDALETGSYRNAFQTRAAEGVSSFTEAALALVSNDVVGFAMFQGGEWVAADIFDSSALLRKVAPRLLVSYAMTAVRGGDGHTWGEGLSRAPEDMPEAMNEDPDDRAIEFPTEEPGADIAQNPNDHASWNESPIPIRANSAIGLGSPIGGGGVDVGRSPVPATPSRQESRRGSSDRPVHISLIRR